MKRPSLVPTLVLLLFTSGLTLSAQSPAETPVSTPTPAAAPIAPETLRALTGRYTVQGNITATISLRGEGGLTAALSDGTSYELAPTHGTTFDIKGLNGTTEFRRNAAGIYDEAVSSVSGQIFTATRLPDKPAAAPITKEALQSMTGRYAAPGDVTVTISLRGEDALTAALSDGTSYELTPTQGTTFSIKGIAGTAEFHRNADGIYNEVVGSLSDGTYTATRIH